MRKGNGWAEKAAEIIKRESGTVLPYRPSRYHGCDCRCHETCHTCGRPFVNGQMHTNCADSLETSHVWYAPEQYAFTN